MGYRMYSYGAAEAEAVVTTAYQEMLGRMPRPEELANKVAWLQAAKGTADQIRRELLGAPEFTARHGVVAAEACILPSANVDGHLGSGPDGVAQQDAAYCPPPSSFMRRRSKDWFPEKGDDTLANLPRVGKGIYSLVCWAIDCLQPPRDHPGRQ